MRMKHDQPETELDPFCPEAEMEEEPILEEPSPEDSSSDITNELNEAIQKRDEYLNLAQRVQADFDNFRRRNNAVRAEAFDEGAIAFIKTLLPVIDNMERAMVSAKDSADTALRDGVVMIQNQLMETLQKRGVTPIDRLHEKFDPTLENAVLQGTPEDGEPGTVCEVFQKGYRMDKIIIRHAMVKVVPE